MFCDLLILLKSIVKDVLFKFFEDVLFFLLFWLYLEKNFNLLLFLIFFFLSFFFLFLYLVFFFVFKYFLSNILVI